MEYQTRFENEIAVVTIAGRLDGVTAPECDQNVRELIEGGTNRLIIDLGALEYISSAGMRCILLTAKLLKEKNGQFYLANVTGNVRSVFDMSGFSNIFQITDSVATALDKLQ